MMNNKYKVLIISCWSLLIVCCLFKLFGANIFIVGVEEGNFKLVCEFINNNIIIRSICNILMNIIGSGFYYMAVLKDKRPRLKWFMPLIVYAILKQVFRENYSSIFFILDFGMTIGLPIIINYKKWKSILLGCLLTLIFQILSMFLKLDNFVMFDENFLIGTILSIDYYIMLILYYLYSNYNDLELKREEK